MAVGAAICEKCGKEFKWKRTTGVPARWCSIKCRRTRRLVASICEVCEKKYFWKMGKNGVTSRFCSRICMYRKVHTWNKKGKFVWDLATEEEKKKRMLLTFSKHVVKNGGCWSWSGCIRKDGYAPFGINGRQIGAHVASWVIHKGPVPNGLCVLHKCDNRKCTNPDHLFLGTHQDNIEDRVKKGRSCCGERHHCAKISKEDVVKIKDMTKSGRSCEFIAKILGVTAGCVNHIKNGKTWKHIKEPND